MLISCDTDHAQKSSEHSLLLNMRIEDQFLKDMASDIQRVKEADRDLDLFICK